MTSSLKANTASRTAATCGNSSWLRGQYVRPLRRHRTEEVRGSIIYAHRTGVAVEKILKKEGTYGSNAIEQMAESFGENSRTLYAMRDLAKTYSEKALLAQIEKPMANGQLVTLAHIMAIITIGESELRKRFWTRVMTESMSASQLRDEISAAGLQKGKKRGVRPIKAPGNPMIAASQLVKYADSLHRRYAVWETSLFDEVDQMPPAKITPTLQIKLEEALKAVIQLRSDDEAAVAKLEHNLTRVRQVVQELEARQAEAKKSEEAGKTCAKGRQEHEGQRVDDQQIER